MNENRRDFLKKAGYAGLGLSCGFPLLNLACKVSGDGACEAGAAPEQYGMVIDVDKCRREDVRLACSAACKAAHNLPDTSEPGREIRWIWTEKYEQAFPDQTHGQTDEALRGVPVLVLCNHCSNPACVKVCPTKATWKRSSDGVVMMDMHRCIGCRYCVVACPYGSRSFNWHPPRPNVEGEIRPEYPTRDKGVVEKCTFCAERIRTGDPPACVEAANRIPGAQGALTFGKISDPESAVSKLLREHRTISRRLGLGTGPNVYYIV